MTKGKREPKTISRNNPPPIQGVEGKIFTSKKSEFKERVWVLLWSNKFGWVLCHAWSGIKGYNPFENGEAPSLEGCKDKNVFDPENYYQVEELNTKAKNESALVNAVISAGYEPIYQLCKTTKTF